MQLSKHYVQQIGFIQQQNLPYTVQLTFSIFISPKQKTVALIQLLRRYRIRISTWYGFLSVSFAPSIPLLF